MFARAPTFHVDAYVFGLRIICVAQLLLELRIFLERRHFNRRRHFRAPTFRAPTFRAPTF